MTEELSPQPKGRLPAGEQPIEEPARPTATWPWWEALLVFVLAILVVGFVTYPLFSLIPSRGMARIAVSVVDDALLLVSTWLWLRTRHPRWKEIIGFPRRPWPEVRAGVAFGLIIYPLVVFGLGAFLRLVLEAASGRSVRAPRQLPPNLGGGRVAVAAILALVAAPVWEEFFFRGCLFRALRDQYGFALGAAGSALAFGGVHYLPGPWQDSVLLISVMVGTGLGLAYLYERRRNIVATMAAHATFNLVAITLILSLR